MSLLIAILIGALVGGITGYFILEDIDFLVLNILTGIVGSIIGLAFNFFLIADATTTSFFSWPSTLCSLIGALATVLFFDFLQRIIPKRIAHTDSAESDTIDED